MSAPGEVERRLTNRMIYTLAGCLIGLACLAGIMTVVADEETRALETCLLQARKGLPDDCGPLGD